MNANSKIADPLRGLSRLVRPHYSPGLLLQDDDLSQAVDYTRELSRLLFRSLFGCGVVCGLEVTPADDCGKLRIDIDKGVALDCHGDPVEVPSLQTIRIDPTCGPPIPTELCIVLRRSERCCAPRTAICDDSDEDEPASVCTRERDGFEIRVLTDCPKCGCGCPQKAPRVATGEAVGVPVAEGMPMDAPAPAPAAARIGAGGVAKKVAKSTARSESKAAEMQVVEGAATPRRRDCQCADPESECYKDHYDGKCACDCCDDEWIVLARVKLEPRSKKWVVDHSVRRFVRPVLMADPLVLRPPKPL